jgi:cytochrome P450
MRKVIRTDDIPARLVPAVEDAAEKIVASAGGRLEVVDALVRRITFDVLGAYFGIPDPPNSDLRVWATRLLRVPIRRSG